MNKNFSNKGENLHKKIKKDKCKKDTDIDSVYEK